MSVQQRIKEFDDKLNADLEGFALLEQVSAATRLRRSHIAFGASGLVTVMVFLGFGASLLCNVVGFVYPVYASFKAIETPCPEDDKQWLTYWVVYASMAIVESFSTYILYWVPFFYVIKLGFLVWCMHPTTKGATVVYSTVIAEFLKKHETKIDSTIRQSVDMGRKVGSGAVGVAAGVARDNAGAVLSGLASAAARQEEGKKDA